MSERVPHRLPGSLVSSSASVATDARHPATAAKPCVKVGNVKGQEGMGFGAGKTCKVALGNQAEDPFWPMKSWVRFWTGEDFGTARVRNTGRPQHDFKTSTVPH